MHLFNPAADGSATELSQFTRTPLTLSSGNATIRRKLIFVADANTEDGADIIAHKVFPQKYAAHPRHSNFRFYGNADISPINDNSKYWIADLEYSTKNPNSSSSSSSSGGSSSKDEEEEKTEVEPWKLKPTDIKITYPTYTQTMRLDAFDIRVANSAGDPLPVETQYFNEQISFSYAKKSWDPDEAYKVGFTYNDKPFKIAGSNIPEGGGLLYPPEASFLRVYENDGTLKWEYWNVTVTILIENQSKSVLDIGNRAKFSSLDLSKDAMLSAAVSKGANINTTIGATPEASQICHFRLQTNMGKDPQGRTVFAPMGDLVFCSWQQFITARQLYWSASMALQNAGVISSIYELQCEQDTDMPLQDGYLKTRAIQGHPDYDGSSYNTRNFSHYKKASWDVLSIPI